MAKQPKSRPVSRAETAEKPPTKNLELGELIGYNLRRAHTVQRARFAAVFGPYDIRPVQLSILGLIYDNPGLKQAELGRMLEIKRANIVPLLTELERRKLVSRRPSTTDRRAHVLHLTAAGEKLTAELLELHARLESDFTECLGPGDRDQLLVLLKKVRRLATSPGLTEDE